MGQEDHAQTWNQRYQESERMWSGKVNTGLESMVSSLEPGTALDLGCGEGADVVWLAEQGWYATGVDISSVAIERATEAARARKLTPEQAQFITADVTTWQSPEAFDLVNAAFLHSHTTFDRAAALDTAKRHVAPDGYLVVISHATFPPWAKAHHESEDHDHPEHEATTPESELALLELDPAEWTVEVAELRARQAIGPDGQHATLDDTIILARRSAAE